MQSMSAAFPGEDHGIASVALIGTARNPYLRRLPLPEQVAYTPAFFDDLARDTRESARAVVPVVNKLLQPASVLDVGCGVGVWVDEWGSAGVSDGLGIDGNYVDRAALRIPVGQVGARRSAAVVLAWAQVRPRADSRSGRAPR